MNNNWNETHVVVDVFSDYDIVFIDCCWILLIHVYDDDYRNVLWTCMQLRNNVSTLEIP